MRKVYTILWILIICSVFLVGAELITHYFERQAIIEVTQPISGYGAYSQNISGESGDSIYGEKIIISNNGTSDRTINIFSDNNESEIQIRYIYGIWNMSSSNNMSLIIKANESIRIDPYYTLDIALASGTYEIKTFVSPVR